MASVIPCVSRPIASPIDLPCPTAPARIHQGSVSFYDTRRHHRFKAPKDQKNEILFFFKYFVIFLYIMKYIWTNYTFNLCYFGLSYIFNLTLSFGMGILKCQFLPPPLALDVILPGPMTACPPCLLRYLIDRPRHPNDHLRPLPDPDGRRSV